MEIDPAVVVGLAGMALFIGWILWAELHTRRRRHQAPSVPPPLEGTVIGPRRGATRRKN